MDESAALNGAKDPTSSFTNLPKRRLDRARAAYYALITHLDDQIGRLINGLQEYGVLNETLILFTSDHGEMMGDHHYFRKSLPYEGSAKIPFIVFDPGETLGLLAGSRLDSIVELRDIMPTFLEAAGVQIPFTVEGQSVLPLCRGDQTLWRSYIHGEQAYGEKSHHFLTDGREKFIWYSQTGEEQYFDLAADPSEKINAIGCIDKFERIKEWRERLIHELEGREEGFVNNGEWIAGRPISHILKASQLGNNHNLGQPELSGCPKSVKDRKKG